MKVAKFKLYDGRDPREIPAYLLNEAAHYTGVPVATLRDWIKGGVYRTTSGEARSKPLIVVPEKGVPMLSFLNLIEVHVLSAIRRKHRIAMPRVRTALDFLSKKYNSQHPLAEHDLDTDGIDLFVEKFGELINISRGGQLAMKEILSVYLTRIERDENGLAKQLFPFTRPTGDSNDPKVVSINARIAFGKPVIAGTGVPTSVIAERYKTGESIAEIADDYRLQANQIEEAIRYEFPFQAAA